MDSFLLSGASSSLLVMLAVITFGAMMTFKMSSFKMAIAAALLVGLYALLDSYKNSSAAVGQNGSLIGPNVVCIDRSAYMVTGAGLFDSSEGLSPMRDANGSTVPCVKKADFR